MYDFSHAISDAVLVGIQIEFSPLNLQYTVLSKRKLINLFQTNAVSGWDDPRMPTISGMRRRRFPPSHYLIVLRTHGHFPVLNVLNPSVPRAFYVLNPLKGDNAEPEFRPPIDEARNTELSQKFGWDGGLFFKDMGTVIIRQSDREMLKV
mmetsp:Transcript_51549/g.60231  ORF Transcript_51549/g.60231 Transcript_51549/m.60231 type:complete len:150 (-) Transcript_51549:107-556(-)